MAFTDDIVLETPTVAYCWGWPGLVYRGQGTSGGTISLDGCSIRLGFDFTILSDHEALVVLAVDWPFPGRWP
jgi:hypothetical protein